MSVKVRMQRHGAKKRPYYRIVVADSHSPRDGKFLELVGTYDPSRSPALLDIKLDRVEHWIGLGAQGLEGLSRFRPLAARPLRGFRVGNVRLIPARGYRLLCFKKTPALTRPRRLRVGSRVPGDVSANSCVGEVALTSCVGTR